MVTRLSSFGKEEYPKGEVVGENASLPTTPSLRATPPSGRRGAEIASRCTLFSVLSFTSCDSESIEPSMSGEAITATAEMPKNLATLTITLGSDRVITLDDDAVSISEWKTGETINIGK
ncbi:MAG: hypothetical protein IJ494_07550 [Bacteroides sp.]|nr:hypothetical protein [Bacteroides sp.]